MIIMLTNPVFESILEITPAWSTMAVIGSVLLPGTRVMLLIVELPTTPAIFVERMRVTLPIAMVIRDGFGIYAYPWRFGCPGGAVRFILTFVTLKPANPLRPATVRLQSLAIGFAKLTFVCR